MKHIMPDAVIEWSQEAGDTFIRNSVLARVEFEDGYAVIVRFPDGCRQDWKQHGAAYASSAHEMAALAKRAGLHEAEVES